MDVYVDVLIAENLVMNYLIIWLTTKIIKEKTNSARMLAASAVGALYALLLFFPGYKVLYSVVMKVILSFLIVVIAFAPATLSGFVKQLSVFYLVSFVLGGAVFGLFYFTNTGITIGRGIFFIKGIPLSILIGAGGITMVFIKFCVIPLYNYLERKSLYITFDVLIGDMEASIRGLIDTGNELYDPITSYPVIIVEYTKIMALIPPSIRRIFENHLEDNLEEIYSSVKSSNWMPRLRLIPFSSLGKERGMLLGFKADRVRLNNKEFTEVIIGVYSKNLSPNGEYGALLNPDLIR